MDTERTSRQVEGVRLSTTIINCPSHQESSESLSHRRRGGSSDTTSCLHTCSSSVAISCRFPAARQQHQIQLPAFTNTFHDTFTSKTVQNNPQNLKNPTHTISSGSGKGGVQSQRWRRSAVTSWVKRRKRRD